MEVYVNFIIVIKVSFHQREKKKKKKKKHDTGSWNMKIFSFPGWKYHNKMTGCCYLQWLHINIIYTCRHILRLLNFKGKVITAAMLVFVFLYLWENVIVTWKIVSFSCCLGNFLLKNEIVFFFGNQISKWRSFEKKRHFDLLSLFLVARE